MHVFVNVRDPELGPRFREWAERRVLLAFTRYGREVLRAELTVSDDNGPRGGVDKRCSLAVTTRRFGTLSFVDVAGHAGPAVTGAIHRARRVLHRRLAQRRTRRVAVTGRAAVPAPSPTSRAERLLGPELPGPDPRARARRGVRSPPSRGPLRPPASRIGPTSVNLTTLTFANPANVPCDNSIGVTNPDAQTASVGFDPGFNMIPGGGWSPSPLGPGPSGPAAGGTDMIAVITSTDPNNVGLTLVPGTTVTVGGTPVPVSQAVLANAISFNTPPGLAGAGAPGRDDPRQPDGDLYLPVMGRRTSTGSGLPGRGRSADTMGRNLEPFSPPAGTDG